MTTSVKLEEPMDVLEGGADGADDTAELERLQAELYGEGGKGDDSVEPESETAQVGDEAAAPSMTKSQMKKKARLERLLAKRAEGRKREKEVRAAKRAAANERKAAELAEMTEEQKAALFKEKQAKRQALKAQEKDLKARLKKSLEDGPQIVIDLDWESYMTESDVRHLVAQLAFTYAANKQVERPAHMMLTSLKGGVAATAKKMISGMENWLVTRTEQHYSELFCSPEDKARLVYLTADSSNELEGLDDSKVYIIGGIVDHNRHKGLCEEQARASGIATARLPITNYVQLSSRAVLTVNHVFQILVEWYNCPDWAVVLDKVLPQRKRADNQQKQLLAKEQQQSAAGQGGQQGATGSTGGAAKAEKESLLEEGSKAFAGDGAEASQEGVQQGAAPPDTMDGSGIGTGEAEIGEEGRRLKRKAEEEAEAVD